MNVQQLREILDTFPDDMEIVIRAGYNSGAKNAHSIRKWNSGPNPNAHGYMEIPLLLTDMPNGTWFGKNTKEVLVIN